MILSCPSCSARFNVKAEALGTKGRTVKCAKCAHKWHAMPEGVAAPTPVPAQQPATETAPPPPQASAVEAAPPPPQPETVEAPPPPPPPPQPEAAETPPPPPPPDDLADDIPDDDTDRPPIPPRRTGNQETVKKRSTLKWWIALAAVIVVLSSASVIWRKSIVVLYPPANGLFMMINLPVDTLGHGLVIHMPETGLRLDGEDRVLTIKGQIENTTGRSVDVPIPRASLRDTKGIELQIWTFLAEDPRVLPGERVNYESEVRNPAQGATGLDITFTRQDEEKKPETK